MSEGESNGVNATGAVGASAGASAEGEGDRERERERGTLRYLFTSWYSGRGLDSKRVDGEWGSNVC